MYLVEHMEELLLACQTRRVIYVCMYMSLGVTRAFFLLGERQLRSYQRPSISTCSCTSHVLNPLRWELLVVLVKRTVYM